MTNQFDYSIELPYLLNDDTGVFSFCLDSSKQCMSTRHFLRLDLYPLIAPSHMKRHYGFWDIPFTHITSQRTQMTLNISEGILSLLDEQTPCIQFRSGFPSIFQDPGYFTLHASIWTIPNWLSKSKMLHTKAYSGVLVRHGWALPLSQITLPVTDRCNLNCVMCPRHTASDLQEKDMPKDIFSAVVEVAPTVTQIFTQCFGEPLLNPDIFEIVKTLKNRMPADGEVGFSTNGTLLNKENTVNLLNVYWFSGKWTGDSFS